MASDKNDFSITWGYIVEMMDKAYGLKPDSTVPISFGRIAHLQECIWNDFYENRKKENDNVKK